MTTKEQLAAWIEAGLNHNKVYEAYGPILTDLTSSNPETVTGYNANIFGLAFIGKVGDSTKAFKTLILGNGRRSQPKVSDMAAYLNIPLDLAEKLDELHYFKDVKAKDIARLLRGGEL